MAKVKFIDLVVEPSLGAAGCYWHTGKPCDHLRATENGGFECTRHGELKTHYRQVAQAQPVRATACANSV